jgi:hypothetical protein
LEEASNVGLVTLFDIDMGLEMNTGYNSTKADVTKRMRFAVDLSMGITLISIKR